MCKAYFALPVLALEVLLLACSPADGGRVSQPEQTTGGTSANRGAGGTSNVVPQLDAGFVVQTTGGTTGAGGATECGRHDFPVQAKPADMLLVLDRSASMVEDSTPTKWSQVIPALHGVINATSSSLWWGLKVFPVGTDSQCTEGTYPAGVTVDVGANNGTAMNSAVDAVQPTGNGTPTADAVNEAVKYLQSLPDGNPKYILLATDGEPSCNGMTGSTDSKGAASAAITAVGNAASAGFRTFVVGIATSKDTASTTLNSMASAGFEPVMNPNPMAPRYYMASTQDQMIAAFNSITAVVKSCLYPLGSPPPAPDHVNVKINDQKVEFDATGTNGWNFTGTDMLTIQFFGQACADAMAATSGAVLVIFGCKNDPIIIT